MASSYSFKDFLSRLERSSIAHIKPHYYQNQALFVNRPDMLVRAVSGLSYAKGAELLRAARYVQEVPVEAHRAVLAQMLKHNNAQQRELMAMGVAPSAGGKNGGDANASLPRIGSGGDSGDGPASSRTTSSQQQRFADWRLALEVFKEAHTTYGNQTPMRVYQSTLRLLGPSRGWAEAVKVLKYRQQVSDVTAPMLVDAAVCHATPAKYKEALRLLNIAHSTMPSYFALEVNDSGSGSSRRGIDLVTIGERSVMMHRNTIAAEGGGGGEGGDDRQMLLAGDQSGGGANGQRVRISGSKRTAKRGRKSSSKGSSGNADSGSSGGSASLRREMKALDAEEAEALAMASNVRNPFSLMPPERPADAAIDEAAAHAEDGDDGGDSAGILSAGLSSSSSHHQQQQSLLSPRQQSSQEAHVLLSLINILAATPWEEAKQQPLLMGALEVVINGGAAGVAAAVGRERKRLSMGQQMVLGAGGGGGGASPSSSSSDAAALLGSLTDPLPVVEAFTVGFLPQGQGLQMQRDLLPMALANVPWEDALKLLFGVGPSSSSSSSSSSLEAYMIPHTSVSWTPSLLATMLGKAPSAAEAAKLSSLLPASFMRHRDTAVSLARAQLTGDGEKKGGVSAGAESSSLLSGAELALATLQQSSVAAAATSSITSAEGKLGDSSSSSTTATAAPNALDGLVPSGAEASQPFPCDLASTLVLRLWSEAKPGKAVDAANLCMVTRGRLTLAALVAALECAVKISIELVEQQRADKIAEMNSSSSSSSSRNDSRMSDSDAYFQRQQRQQERSVALAAVHWKTAVSWALQLQEGHQGDALGLADHNKSMATSYTTYGRRNGSVGGGASSSSSSSFESLFGGSGYSSTLSQGTSPSASAFVRAATSSLEEAVLAQQRHQLFEDAAATSQEGAKSRYSDWHSVAGAGGGGSGATGSSSNSDVSFIPDRGPALHPRVLSLLVYLCAVQRSPMGALRLIGYASANNSASSATNNNNNVLAHTEEIKALLFCAQYKRPQEAKVVLATLERRLTAAAAAHHKEEGSNGANGNDSSDAAAVQKALKPLAALYRALFPPPLPTLSNAKRGTGPSTGTSTAAAAVVGAAAKATASSAPSGRPNPAAVVPPPSPTSPSSTPSSSNADDDDGDDPFAAFDFGGAVALRDNESARAKWGGANSTNGTSSSSNSANPQMGASSAAVPDEDDDDEFDHARASSARSL